MLDKWFQPDYKPWVGCKVQKYSGKPFKSGLKVNTVKDIIDHPDVATLPAFMFHEDDSYVEARQCFRVT